MTCALYSTMRTKHFSKINLLKYVQIKIYINNFTEIILIHFFFTATEFYVAVLSFILFLQYKFQLFVVSVDIEETDTLAEWKPIGRIVGWKPTNILWFSRPIMEIAGVRGGANN